MSEAESETANGSRRRAALDIAAHAALFLAAVAFYTLTLNGDVQPADSGELQIAAVTLGIPHPPGYPLFTMLGWLLAQAPVGSPYARVSFLSVIASAITLVMVSLTVQRALSPAGCAPASRLAAGLLAALALGGSTTFWAQATTTNIRSLTALFTALMLYASARSHATGRASSLALFAAAFGLGVGHHISLVFIGVALGAHVLYLTWRADRHGFWRAASGALGIFAATQLVWLYLPLRDAAGARFAPGNLTTPDGLLFHIFARGFAGDMLAFAAPEFLFDRLALLPTLLTFQFSVPVLVGVALAAIAMLWRLRVLGAVWLSACAAHLFITITYRAPQTVEYAMPCWVILSVVLGAGLGGLLDGRASCAGRAPSRDAIEPPLTSLRLRSRAALPRALAHALLLAVIAFAGRDAAQRWPSFVYLSRDRSARAAAEAVLQGAQPAGVVLSQWHQATPMWALQDIEGLRRDVRVEYVFPRGAQPYAETFAEQAAQRALSQTVYVTSLFADELAGEGLQATPLRDRPAWRVARRFDPPAESDGELFDARIAVIGPAYLDGRTVEVGQLVMLDVGWRLRAAPQPGDSITVRILRRDGRLAANADLRLPADARAGDHAMQRVALGLPLDLSPGSYDILVGAYRLAEGGFVQYRDRHGAAFVSVAALIVAPASLPPATQRPLASADGPTAQQPRLIGVDYDTGIAGQCRVWTHWRLGRAAAEVVLADAAGQPLAPPRTLSAATTPDRAQYLSLAFDIPPTRGIRVMPFGLRLPDYRDGQRYVPFADQMALVGASAHGGAALKVDLHWLAMRPLVNDYVISARVEGDGLYRAHDSVPALGALPTLKWIRGSRVMDRHPFELGDYRGALRVGVVVYDSATRLPLPPLDERYENGVSIIGP
ncbi:MAG: protein O-mannosyl-transferase family [Thermoflexales bacterium]